MAGRHLLDTNIVIALFKNDDSVRSKIANSAEVFVPPIVLGELFYGAKHAGDVARHMRQVQDFARASTVLLCDVSTAEVYGEIKHELKLKGRPIPENDIWVAAVAKQHGLTVVSRDRHFTEVGTLQLEQW